VRAAANRDQDRFDPVQPALLDYGDVTRRFAHHRVDGRAEHGPGLRPLACQRHLGGLGVGASRLGGGRRAAPTEDDEVRALLADRLDHPVGGVAADADHRPQLDALLVADVEDPLQETT
jgi:hypothetical protein